MKHQPRILLVDDEEDLLEILQDKLSDLGYDNVLTSTNGRSAVGMLAASSFDLILTDVRMPLLSGVELLNEVKKVTPNLPVVLITGFADISDIEALNLGAFDLLEKPIDFNLLSHVVKAALCSPEERIKKIQVGESLPEKIHVVEGSLAQSVLWGQRGFFVPTGETIVDLEPQDRIRFEIQTEDSFLKGAGTVRWCHASAAKSSLNGFGVFVEQLDESSFEAGLKNIRSYLGLATIPVPD